MYGFLLCFASTCFATVLHYVFDMPAPYPVWSMPKIAGISGGVILALGCVEMIRLKLKSDASLGAQNSFGGEVGFIGLLGFVAVSGFMLYFLGNTVEMPTLLVLHLGAVLAFFVLTPFTKMAHGFYRMAALVRDAQRTG